MKYPYQPNPIPQNARKSLNEKVLYLIDSHMSCSNSITPADIYNAYTGDGGLHGLERSDYANYSAYSEAKKEIENGQFFTPPKLCDFIISCLRLSDQNLIADLTCGMGSFFNFLPTETNAYGCELDMKAFKVAHFLYPAANIKCQDLRSYNPEIRFDYIIGNPPFNLRWWSENGEDVLSHLYYCLKAAELIKPLGIMALIVPQSFLADEFTDSSMIKKMEQHFSFLGQIGLPEDSFSAMGVSRFPTKLQFWQKKSTLDSWKAHPYSTRLSYSLISGFDIAAESQKAYQLLLMPAKAVFEQNGSHIFLELARTKLTSQDFNYTVQKLLYHIKIHPIIKCHYSKCCEYLHRFYTQKQPPDMPHEMWCQKRLTEAKVLSYLKRTLKKQNPIPERNEIMLVKQGHQFIYKGYSAKVRRQMPDSMQSPIPVYQAVLQYQPGAFPGYEKLLSRKQKAYRIEKQKFADMQENSGIAEWLTSFSLWDAANMEEIRLNPTQRHDINRLLQKRYSLLQWEQGSGKTLAGIAVGTYRMQHQGIHSTWVVSSAISIRNNWNIVMKNYGLSYVFVERLEDLKHIRQGDFVLLTLNKVGILKKRLCKYLQHIKRNIQLILDESDEISNPASLRCRAVLACFRRSRMKLLTTGTSTRNNIAEFAPQLELLYNNSINMISWSPLLYHHSKDSEDDAMADADTNPYYGKPIPAFKQGYSLFTASHLPEKVTVFGLEKRNQDIYNADALNDLLEKTVITRTFEDVSGKNIKRLHQIPLQLAPEEKEVYQTAISDFNKMRQNYFSSTGNSRKDAMMRLIQQIVLLLRIGAAPDTVQEYCGDTPVKVMTAVEMIALWENEIVAIGVRHKNVLASYEKAIREYLPERQLFVVTGSNTSFAKRRALHQTLKTSKNGILLCTQQSLPSSVNFEYVNKVIIPELHYNHSGMSQFYFRFIRYNSTEYKDIYFLTYAGSIESNLLQMILAKEKLTLFMKGQDVDLDDIYERFNIDYDLLSQLMVQEKDDKGNLRIQWGKQLIA